MHVETSIRCVKSEAFLLSLDIILLLEVVLHELVVSTRAADNSRVFIFSVTVLLTFDGLLLHAHEHLVGQLDLTSVVLVHTLLLLAHPVFVHLLYILKESLKIAFLHIVFQSYINIKLIIALIDQTINFTRNQLNHLNLDHLDCHLFRSYSQL